MTRFWIICLLLVVGVFSLKCDSRNAESDQQKPNILFILTDDQETGSLSEMPELQALLVEEGTTFENAFATDPLCCPSRATFLRGQYAHNHQIEDNGPPLGGHEKFRELGLDRSTVATWLDEAGYETAYLGKYMNGYDDTTYVPPGWDEWFGWLGNYYSPAGEYRLNNNGHIETYNRLQIHDTDLLRKKAVSFLENRVGDDEPFFMWLATNAPHPPAYVAKRHERMFSDSPLPSPPSFNEADVSDKPKWLRRSNERLNESEVEVLERLYRRHLAALQSVDDTIGALVDTLDETGQLDDTYIVFASDNGVFFGEHRLTKKGIAYEEAIRIPFVVRGPGVATQRVDQLVVNNDFAPTVADLAGVTPPDFVDGKSFAPLLRSEKPGLEEWRRGFLVEHYGPEYQALRTNEYAYIEWPNGDRELYDLEKDPYQLRSLHQTADPALLEGFASRLDRLRNCSAEQCRTAETK